MRFALELRDDLVPLGNNLGDLPKARIEQNVVTNIFGGNNVIASRDFAQNQVVWVEKGDWQGLATTLRGLGLTDPDVSNLKTAIDGDSEEPGSAGSGMGRRAKTWLQGLAGKSGDLAVRVGAEVVSRCILGYLGRSG